MALTDFVRWNTGSFPTLPRGKSGLPLQSSPGGIRLQDYHWSGGMYSPDFISYDKWGYSDPQNVYGPDVRSKMISDSSYDKLVQDFPQQFKNYELLDNPEDKPEPKTTPIKKKMEHFDPPINSNVKYHVSIWEVIATQICLLIILYILDKIFGGVIASIGTIVKVILIVIFVLVLLFIILRSKFGWFK